MDGYFRRGIILGSKLICGSVLEHPADFCDSEINQLQLKRVGNEDVGGIDIPVNHGVSMGVLDGIGQLLYQVVPG